MASLKFTQPTGMDLAKVDQAWATVHYDDSAVGQC
jgi:hypothetical protein